MSKILVLWRYIPKKDAIYKLQNEKISIKTDDAEYQKYTTKDPLELYRQSYVYGIFDKNKKHIVYIGKSKYFSASRNKDSMFNRIYDHLARIKELQYRNRKIDEVKYWLL